MSINNLSSSPSPSPSPSSHSQDTSISSKTSNSQDPLNSSEYQSPSHIPNLAFEISKLKSHIHDLEREHQKLRNHNTQLQIQKKKSQSKYQKKILELETRLEERDSMYRGRIAGLEFRLERRNAKLEEDREREEGIVTWKEKVKSGRGRERGNEYLSGQQWLFYLVIFMAFLGAVGVGALRFGYLLEDYAHLLQGNSLERYINIKIMGI